MFIASFLNALHDCHKWIASAQRITGGKSPRNKKFLSLDRFPTNWVGRSASRNKSIEACNNL
jgi:hypothetical protein